ncbi:hypothetical protein D3C72_1340450 [compost metagenome]
MRHRQAGFHLQQLHRQVVRAARAGRAVIDAALGGLGLGDEFLGALDRAGRADHQDHREAAQQRHRSQVLARVVGERFVQHRVEHQRAVVGRQHGIAVGGRARRLGRADGGIAARLVVHHHRLADLGRQPLADGARQEVRAAAGGVGDDPADRLGRVGVGGMRGGGGQHRQGQRANGQALEVEAGHGGLSPCWSARCTAPVFLFRVNHIRIA